MPDFDNDIERKKDGSEKVRSEKTTDSARGELEGLSLQELIGSLEANPSIVKYLSFEKINEIAGRIGNQRLEAILGGGGPLLRQASLRLGNKENRVNDISTETPQLIELEG